VLENGPASRYANYFDVEWDPPEAKLRNTVLLPILSDHYGRVLESHEIQIQRVGGSFRVRYHEHALPVAPTSIDGILGAAASRSGSEELAFLADAHGRLPLSTSRDAASLRRRHRDKEVLRGLMQRLCEEHLEVAEALDAQLLAINADADAVDAILERQNYRLAFWRTASRDLGYRRFFDINTLVGLRTEDERVFEETHELLLRWLKDGLVDGFRVDHPDGLRDPEGYLVRVASRTPRPWLVVEKILMTGERLPESWPVDGTTGYDFMSRVSGLFVDPGGEDPLTRFYAQFTGEPTDWAEIVRRKKDQVLRDVLGSDLNRLTALFLEICEGHRRHRDYTRHELHEALRELVIQFPVYRTYVRAEAGQVRPEDQARIHAAVEAARKARPDLDASLLAFLEDLLLLRVRGPVESELVMRFQQVTGPTMAKGVEDTAFYCYNRLVCLNEVGGDPGRFGTEVEEFHAACARAQARWARGLLATSTHDSKRSEDVRARLNLLSEIPARWESAVRRWSATNERYRRGGPPDRNAEYLLYQTLVGAWPLEAERALTYMEKAAREARAHTSWVQPNAAYEQALHDFVQCILSDERFTADLEAFVRPLIQPGRINSLSQTLLKLTAPGIPDLYQGTELWDLSLVDPDNRRPVDYEKRKRILAAVREASPEQVLARADEGAPKLWTIRKVLTLRRAAPHLFAPGTSYEPLSAQGSRGRHVVAYMRAGGVLVVVPRLVLGLGGNWGDTSLALPAGAWHNVLTGDKAPSGSVRLAELLRRFPVALLVKGGA
jgi:(1->4)-alpha-D-glucan 1-alpha-D-glucosylmutase